MSHLVPSTLVREAVERVALSARPNAPILREDHSPNRLHRFASTRPALWTAVRDELCERRRARAQYRGLKRDLALYTTRAEVDDLLGSIQGQGGAEASSHPDRRQGQGTATSILNQAGPPLVAKQN